MISKLCRKCGCRSGQFSLCQSCRYSFNKAKNNSRKHLEARRYRRQVERALANDEMVICYRCGRFVGDYLKYEIDHIVPLAKGGRDVMENLQLLCVDCHQDKNAA